MKEAPQPLACGRSRLTALPRRWTWRQEARAALMIAADAVALSAAGLSAYLLRARPVRGQPLKCYLGL